MKSEKCWSFGTTRSRPDQVRELAQTKLTDIRVRIEELSHLEHELTLLLNLCRASPDGCPILTRLMKIPQTISHQDKDCRVGRPATSHDSAAKPSANLATTLLTWTSLQSVGLSMFDWLRANRLAST